MSNDQTQQLKGTHCRLSASNSRGHVTSPKLPSDINKKEIIAKSNIWVYVPEQEGLTTRNQLTQSTSHEDGSERDRLHLKREETNMELVHKALSMGGKCMMK